MSLGNFDPDWTNGGGLGRPGWATPKTPLAIRALTACGRKYFKGQTKHNSEFAIWDAEEVKAVGSTGESYLHKAWLINCIEWAEKTNAGQRPVPVVFVSLLHLITDEDKMNDWKSKNRKQILDDRGKSELSSFDRAARLARKEN